MNKRFSVDDDGIYDNQDKKHFKFIAYDWIDCDIYECCDLLNEQQFIINELRTYNLQHFLEWLVIKGYVTDEPLKDINNVIACVDEFKEYLTELDKFKAWLEVLEDE